MKKQNSPELKKQIQAAQEFLSNLNTESQVALQRRNQIRLETEAETAKLLEKRKKDLEGLEVLAEERLKPLEDKYAEIVNLVGNLEFNRQGLDTEIRGKISKLNALHESLGEVKTQIESEKASVTQLKSEQTGVQSSIDGLKEQISPLQEQLSSLKSEVEELTVKRVGLINIIDQKSKEFEALREESERDLSILTQQKHTLTREIQDSQKQFSSEREELATRKQAADKRDDNLRAREYKVSRDEQMIEQNAGLLNL